jgi:hypothetical protein
MECAEPAKLAPDPETRRQFEDMPVARPCQAARKNACYELHMVRQRTLLGHAAVCSRLLRNTSNVDDRRKLEGLRGRWKRLALDIWRLEAAEVAEQAKALSDVQARVLAEIRPTVH